jgi:hypothetical protein
MVKEENAHYHAVNKFVTAFLNASELAPPELIDEWKNKTNLHKLKNALKKTDKPSHPPRPKSKYIYFCQEVRPLIQDEMRRELIEDGDDSAKINIHKVTCELGLRWKQFNQIPDPEMDKRITELAEVDKKRYHTEKEAMYNKKDNKNDNHLRSKYLYFCKEERDKNPKITLSNIAVIWANNKDDDKLAERYEAAKIAAKHSKSDVIVE